MNSRHLNGDCRHQRIAYPSVLLDEPLITAVTLVELSVGPLVWLLKVMRSALRQAHLQQPEANFHSLMFDADVAHAFGRVTVSLWRSERTSTARTYDFMITATTLANDLLRFIRAVHPTSFHRGTHQLNQGAGVAQGMCRCSPSECVILSFVQSSIVRQSPNWLLIVGTRYRTLGAAPSPIAR